MREAANGSMNLQHRHCSQERRLRRRGLRNCCRLECARRFFVGLLV